jgi:hypothetical protein
MTADECHWMLPDQSGVCTLGRHSADVPHAHDPAKINHVRHTRDRQVYLHGVWVNHDDNTYGDDHLTLDEVRLEAGRCASWCHCWRHAIIAFCDTL